MRFLTALLYVGWFLALIVNFAVIGFFVSVFSYWAIVAGLLFVLNFAGLLTWLDSL